MAVKYITDKDLWDRFIDDSPHSLIYHKWDFLKSAEKYTHYQFLSCGIYKNEKLVSVFPLFYRKILGVKLLFSPPPQSAIPYLGPVIDKDYENFKQDKKESYLNFIAEEIDSEIKKIKPNYLSAVFVPGIFDIRPFQWLNYQIKQSYTYTINLQPEPNKILDNFTSVCRQNIRKGEELRCKTERCEDVSALNGMLTERYNEQGLNHTVNSDYLKEVMTSYPENIILLGLYDNDKLIGAVLNQVYKKYIGWLGLPKPQDKKYTYVNEFLIWQLIQQAKLMGIERFEISGANKQNLCRYRSKFNPQLEIYFTILKKDIFGKIAEAFYFNFIKKNRNY
ncbi:MAG: GNAT family N-acetyltransferase [Eubacteriales bacterium]